MSKEKIVEILKNNLGSVYCDTCDGGMDSDNCDYCAMYWGISDAFAERIADEIIGEANEDRR